MARPGARVVGGASLDLVAETHRRTCGRTTACDEAATTAFAAARPWGARNPRWQLLVHQPLAALDSAAGTVCPCYLVAWVADDPADADGDPRRDAPAGVAGHGVLLVRGAAFGAAGGARRGRSARRAAVPAIGDAVRRHSRAVLGHGGRRRSLTASRCGRSIAIG